MIQAKVPIEKIASITVEMVFTPNDFLLKPIESVDIQIKTLSSGNVDAFLSAMGAKPVSSLPARQWARPVPDPIRISVATDLPLS